MNNSVLLLGVCCESLTRLSGNPVVAIKLPEVRKSVQESACIQTTPQ